jgi:malic enzyme
VLAALLNALRIVGKRPEDVMVVVVGAGAAGVACTEILLAQGVGDVVVCNRRGALYAGAEGPGRRASGHRRAHQLPGAARDAGTRSSPART